METVEEIDLQPLPTPSSVVVEDNSPSRRGDANQGDGKDAGVGFHYDLPSRGKSRLLTVIVCLVLTLIAGAILGLAVWMNGGLRSGGNDAKHTSNSTQTDTWTGSAVEKPLTESKTAPVPVPRGQVVTAPLLPLPELAITPSKFCTPDTLNATHHHRASLIAIVTKPEDEEVRVVLRQIWSNYLVLISGDLVFVLATSPMAVVEDSIRAEADRYGDLLQIRNITSPTTNYLKTLASLHWAAENCAHSFLVRVNVDVLVQMHSLRRVLDDLSTSHLVDKALIIGDVIQEEHDSTQRVSSNFLKFVYGSFYIVTRPAFRLIVDGCRARRPVSLEEVYLTGTCADYSSVERVDLVEKYHVDMERELKLWRKMFSCLPAHVISVSNVGKDNVFLYWNKAIRDGCYL